MTSGRLAEVLQNNDIPESLMTTEDKRWDFNFVVHLCRTAPVFRVDAIEDFLWTTDKIAEGLHSYHRTDAGNSLISALHKSYLRAPFDNFVLEAYGTVIAVDGQNNILRAVPLNVDALNRTLILPGNILFNLDENFLCTGYSVCDAPTDMPPRPGVKTEDMLIAAGNRHAELIGASLFLMNWKKDVDIEAVRPTRQVKRRAALEGRPEPLPFNVVNIGRWKRLMYSSQAHAASKEQRSHLVRGCTATYIQARPMMGCEICRSGIGHGPNGDLCHVGNFWKAPHFAGNKELGEVKKVYDLSAGILERMEITNG